MSKILVTGASGLLGTEFCRQLKAAGHIVWALDNHSRSNTIPECDEWLNLDLNDVTELSKLPKDFDYIYHYGAINGTSNFYQYPNRVLTNNFICDINVFNFAAGCTSLKKLVYASSSEVVAEDDMYPVPENVDVKINNIHNARWSYRLAKITSENFLANSKLPSVIFRYFNVYGENSKKGHFLGDQIDKIQRNIFSVTGANETRSFCHVSDAIRASIYVAESVSEFDVYNIGNDRELTVLEAAKIIAAALGKHDAVFEQLPGLSGSVPNRRPDIGKLKRMMPFYNPISFEDGIKTIVQNKETKV